MYLNFSNFQGQTSAGGDKPWSKNGDKCRMGGIGKIFAGWGDPPVPPGKKPCMSPIFFFSNTSTVIPILIWISVVYREGLGAFNPLDGKNMVNPEKTVSSFNPPPPQKKKKIKLKLKNKIK